MKEVTLRKKTEEEEDIHLVISYNHKINSL